MADYIGDPDANWLGKSPAMKAIQSLCPEKLPELETTVTALGDKKVTEAYEKLVA